jgi:hypothetical protein
MAYAFGASVHSQGSNRFYGWRQAATVSLAGGRHHLAEYGSDDAVSHAYPICAFSTVGCFPTAVTIAASVVAGGAPLTTGSVTFCCTAAIVGRAQLNGGNRQTQIHSSDRRPRL